MAVRSLGAALVGIVWIVAIVGGCSSAAGVDHAPGGGPVATATPDPAAPSPALTAAPPSSSASAPVTAERHMPEAGVLPRAVSYGMLRWTVTDAVITTERPKTYVAEVGGQPTDTTSLILDLEIRNDDVHVAFATSTARLVAVLPGDATVPGTDLGRRGIPPTSTVDGRYAFEVPAGTGFEGLVVRFEDPGREPSFELPLSGPAPELEVNATTVLDRSEDLDLPGIDMTWTVRELEVGRDWPLPIGFRGGTLVPGARASLDHRWVGITARVDVGRCDCRGGVLDQADSARLLVDGLPYNAAAAESTRPILNASTFSDVMLVFEVPVATGEAMLQVGPLAEPGQEAAFELELPG